MNRSPLTPLGVFTAVAVVIAWIVGVTADWIEFIVIAVGLFLALLFAIPYLIGGRKLRLERELEPEHVHVGDPAKSVLQIFNDANTPSAPRVVEDRINGQAIAVDIPTIAADSHATKITDLPTSKRAVSYTHLRAHETLR